MEWLEFLSLSGTFAGIVINQAFRQFSIPDEALTSRIDSNFENSLKKTDNRILISAKDACARVRNERHSVFSANVIDCILGLIERKSLPNYILHIDCTQETQYNGVWYASTVKSSKIEFRHVTISDIDDALRNTENQSEDTRIRIDASLEYRDVDDSTKKDDGDIILASMVIVSTLKNIVQRSSSTVLLIDTNNNTGEFQVKIEEAAATLEARVTEDPVIANLYSSIENMKFDENNILENIKKLKELEEMIDSRNVVFVGRTGTGKSFTCNIIHHLFSGSNLETYRNGPLKVGVAGSTTSRITKIKIECGKILLWDTPGFADMYGRDPLFRQKIKRAIDDAEQISAIVIMTKNMGHIDADEKRLILGYSSLLPANDSGKIIVVSTQDGQYEEEFQRIRSKQNAKARFADIGFNIDMDNLFFCNFYHEEGKQNFVRLAEKLTEKLQEPPYAVGALQRLRSVLERLKSFQIDLDAKKSLIKDLQVESITYLYDKLQSYLKELKFDSVDCGLQRKITWKFRLKSGIDRTVKAEYRLYIPKVPQNEGIGSNIRRRVDRFFTLRELLMSGRLNVARKIVQNGFIVIQWPDYVQRKGPIHELEGTKIVETDFAVDLESGLTREMDALILSIASGTKRVNNAAERRSYIAEQYNSMVHSAERIPRL